MDSMKAAAQLLQVKNALYFLDIQAKGYLGPTLRERHQSVGMQAARSAGVVVDEQGKLRCPSTGTTTAYEFTNLQMTNCLLQPPAHMSSPTAVAAGRVREVSKLAQRPKPRSFSWSNRENSRLATAKYPGARWEEQSPGFYRLTAGTGRVGDDRRLAKMVNRSWHSDAVVERAEEPGLARTMESFRGSPTVSSSMRQEALDLDSAPAHTRKLADAIDKGYPLGQPSYRVQHVPKNMQIEPGFELSFSLASVAFDPVDVPAYEKDLPEKRPVWFRFPEDTPGVIFDDSDKPGKRRTFHQRPIDGIVRGRFRVASKVKEGVAENEREVLDLEYAGKLTDTRETAPTTPASSKLVGHLDAEARQRTKVIRNQARARIANSKKSLVYLEKPDRDLPIRPASDLHLQQMTERHRSLFGEADAARLEGKLISNEALQRLSPFERYGREQQRNAALTHMATSAIAYRMAAMLDGTKSPQLAVANDPKSSRYYEFVQSALERWRLADSNDPFRKALKNTVVRLFDLEEEGTKSANLNEPVRFGGKEFDSTDSLRDDEGFQALALSIYQNTQNDLGKAGPVRLYRGAKQEPIGGVPDWAQRNNEGGGGSVVDMPVEPLTSYTTNLKEARSYALKNKESSGSLIETTVPSEQIYSMPGSGFGNPGKEEVMVLGGKYPSKVTKPQNTDGAPYGQ